MTSNMNNMDKVDWNKYEPQSGTSELGVFRIDRFFTNEGKSPFEFDIYGNPIKWLAKDVKVSDDSGKVIFTQPSVKRPDFWSSLAIKVVASKYFWGDQAKNERENSIEQLIGRVARFFERQALRQGYMNEIQANIFKDELTAICLNQLAVFNSPVWFNAGTIEYNKEAGGVVPYKWDFALNKVVNSNKGDDNPQCSACFIQGVEDNMEAILALQTAEANLFKAGSGTGSNRSNLRSSKEKLTGGGRASGPVSFMKGYDAYAAIIKSGGKTRRAAKMEILNADHPDIIEFINAKQNEERKAWALIEQGYSGGLNGEAYNSVAFQNCNMSVRVPDGFMEAVQSDGEWQTKYVKNKEICETFKAKDILNKIAEGTWICGDPGMQFDTIINKYHTCKFSGRINASNPCSEYVFLDDTACNLASINLMKFRTENGFDAEKYKKVVKYFIAAMELAVDGSSYPTEKIAKNSHDFRPLGLGYANLGALLMSLGLSYDSEEGRAVAAAVTAIMCGEAYKTSAELASLVGPFPRFEENRKPMLEVMNLHRDAVKKIDVLKMPENLRYLVNEAWDSWSEAIELGEKYGYRNAQATVLAPTGTIAFMLDCDTTGIEPDIALVKYKILSGGGMLKIVNKSVPLALKTLGYDNFKVKEIIDYIDKNDTIEGSSLEDKHLGIFDCAFKPAKGKRSIPHRAHILMMAVTQPFISGAISKTINMPEYSTVSEIADAYVFAWEQGLKAVAIYRDNSKKSQPLNTAKTENEMMKKKESVRIERIERKRMPQTRKSITHKFEIAGHEGYLTIGLHDDGKPGEIFITMHKQGSTIRGLIDAWATSMSLNLQYGATVNDLFNKFRHQKFEPSGFVKNPVGGELDKQIMRITSTTSIVDYVSQFMLNNFGEGAKKINVEIKQLEPQMETQLSIKDFNEGNKVDKEFKDLEEMEIEELENESGNEVNYSHEGLVCPHCGGPAKRLGNCAIFCTSCKQTTRSGCGE